MTLAMAGRRRSAFGIARSEAVRSLTGWLLAACAVMAACFALSRTVSRPLGALLVAGGFGVSLAILLRAALARIRSEQGKITALLNSVPEGVLEVGRDESIRFVNRQLCGLFGYTQQELLGQSVELLVPAGMRAAHTRSRERFHASGSSRPMGSEIEIFGVRKGGQHIPLDISLSYIGMPHSPITYCLVRDLSASKAHERSLLEANRELLESVATLERNASELRQLTEMGELLHTSVTEAELFGIVSHAVRRLFPGFSGAVYEFRDCGQGAAEVMSSWGEERHALRPVIAREDCWALRRSKPHSVIDPADEPRCLHYRDSARRAGRCVPLMGHGELLGVLHLFADAGTAVEGLAEPVRAQLIQALGNQVALSTANLRLRKSLRDQSLMDPLTGLYNRRAVDEWFEREIRNASRNGCDLSLLLIDIDHFKRFNDHCGHECGDRALRQLAGVLRDGLRGEDLICRLGGEEFAVLLPDTSMSDAELVAEKLRSAAERLIMHHYGELMGPLTISIGVATLGVDGQRAEELLRHADRALYRAKANGRNRVQTSNELDRSGRYPRPAVTESMRA
jgi:diguanylate cyclase (GGDEF)-like protein/PAS domain S-box-containing protein